MQELQAQVALELVGLELSAAEERSIGLGSLPGVLWQEGLPVQRFPRLKLDRANYLQQLRKLTTSAEQVPLLNPPQALTLQCKNTGEFARDAFGRLLCQAIPVCNLWNVGVSPTAAGCSVWQCSQHGGHPGEGALHRGGCLHCRGRGGPEAGADQHRAPLPHQLPGGQTRSWVRLLCHRIQAYYSQP